VIKIILCTYGSQPFALFAKPSLCNKTEKKMQTTLKQAANKKQMIKVRFTQDATLTGVTPHSSIWERFINYCQDQEHNRLFWVGIALAVHGCALTPITVMATLFAGPNFFLFMTAMTAMGIAIVTNLAAMPTKVTIPAFFLSVVMDIAILVSCVFLALP
jgi:hypothetical protein